MSTLAARRATPSFPRAPLLGAFALVGISLIAATVGRLTGIGAMAPISTPVSERSLRFLDGPDGSVLVYDANAAAKPISVATGQNGFLRGVLRGFARTRKADGVGDEAPFLLVAWADGRITLQDPSTGRHADLEAFGPTNVAVFARFLIPPPRAEAAKSPAKQPAP